MIEIRLGRLEAEASKLPDACMRCEASAVVRKTRTFTWYPYYARFVPLGIYLFRKSMTVPVPLCAKHQSHWSSRAWFHGLMLTALALLAVLACVVPAALDLSSDVKGVLLAVGLTIGGTCGLAWIITAMVLDYTVIKPDEITDHSITLKNVHPSFQDAVDRFRVEEDERAQSRTSAPKARPPQRSDQFYDPKSGK